MKPRQIIGSAVALCAFATAAILYGVHPALSSDHQDSPTVVANPMEDITDVFVFPSPSNPNNVVFAMDVVPLIPAGMGGSFSFDPNVMYQFKIAHGPMGTTSPEDTVLQVAATGTGANQTLTLYGPAKPNMTGPDSTFVAATGTFPFNATSGTSLPGGITAFAGPRADPFYFDLFQFFKILPDRSYSNPRTGNQLGSSTPTFNGFPAGTLNAPGGYACSTAPAQNALTDVNGGFNVLSIVLEVPRSLISPPGTSSLIHVWATAGTPTGA